MEAGQSSGTKNVDAVWAKLVPIDSRSLEVEIRLRGAVVCSETTSSSSEKQKWCEIGWDSEKDLATIRNLSSNAIMIDGRTIGEEVVHIRSGNEITSGPNREGYLTYIFEALPSKEPDKKQLKISLDVEHARCSICLNIWHDVVTVAPCLHNFCNGCFSEWLRRSSIKSNERRHIVLCPQCRAVVHSVGRNHFLRNIEEAILQTFSSLKRCDEEIALLETYSSIKTNVVLGTQKNPSRKRPLPLGDDNGDMNLPCPQCGTEFGGFRCNRTTTHLQCQGCGGMMPSRPDLGVPQKCLGCDRAFCGAYWSTQGVDSSEFNLICSQETFKRIVDRTISRLPNTIHQNNRYERDVTDRCIQQSGKTLQTVISDWIIKFNNKEIDRTRLQLSNPESITSMTYLCNDCYNKFVEYLLYWFRVSLPSHLLPPDASNRENCWYGYMCRTQQHNEDHARKRNHVCRPTRGNMN